MCELTKKCRACFEEKCTTDYYRDSKKEDGLFIKCKVCVDNRIQVPKKSIVQDGKKKCSRCYLIKLVEEFYPSKKETCGYRSECIQCKLEYGRLYVNKSEYRQQYRNRTKSYTKEYNKRYREENKEKLDEYHKNYVANNRDRRAINRLNRINNNPLEKIKLAIGSSIRAAFKSGGFKKDNRTLSILGCSIEEFKAHIESQFLPWMNWENQGMNEGVYEKLWQLDHIIPICFAKTEEEVCLLNHWSNFQPLCAKLNNEKSCSSQPLSNNILKIELRETEIIHL